MSGYEIGDKVYVPEYGHGTIKEIVNGDYLVEFGADTDYAIKTILCGSRFVDSEDD
jgi:hypothetical protein